jgi:tetratricopeptide (TPR) repeat protein
MKVESVAWVMQGKDSFYTLFYFIAIIFYFQHNETKGYKKIITFSFILIAAALSSLCKIQSLTLPAAFLLIDWWYGKKPNIVNIAEKVLLFFMMFNLFEFTQLKLILCILVVSGYFNFWNLITKIKILAKISTGISLFSFKKKLLYIYLPASLIIIFIAITLFQNYFINLWNVNDSPEYIYYNGFQRFFLVTYSISYYFLRFLFPFNLNNFHPLPPTDNGFLPMIYYLSFVALFLITIAILLIIKKSVNLSNRKNLIFGILLFVIAILPIIQIIDIETRVIVADRYLYLGSAGLSIFFVSGLSFFIKKHSKFKSIILPIALLFIASNIIYSNVRTSVWKNSESFWTSAYRHNPDHYYVLYSMGNLEREKDNPVKAVKYYLKATEKRKDLPFLYLNLADSYLIINQIDSSLIFYNKATQILPEYFDARFNMAIAYIANKDTSRALEELRILEKLHPEESKVFLAEAKILCDKSPESALEKINKAISIRIDNSDYYCERAAIFNNLGNYEKAMEDINKSLSLNINNDRAYYLQGMIFLKNNDQFKANENFRKALVINPQNLEAKKMLNNPEPEKTNHQMAQDPEKLINEAISNAKQSNFDKAIELLNQAVSIDPKNYIAYKNRGNVYANIQKFDNAISDYNIAIKLKPDDAGSYLNRGSAKLKKNDISGACADWEKSNSLGNKNAATQLSKHCR